MLLIKFIFYQQKKMTDIDSIDNNRNYNEDSFSGDMNNF